MEFVTEGRAHETAALTKPPSPKVSKASVTVIIINWNSGSLLHECLNRLDRQTVAPARVLVVDNASSDGSAAQAASRPGVTLMSMQTNLGFAAGNNRALAACDTEWVALLNADAFPEPDWLQHLLAAAARHPDAAAFGSRQMMLPTPTPEGIPLGSEPGGVLDGIGDDYHISGLVWRRQHGERLSNADTVLREIFSPCAAAALYRRQALLDVGGFDEDYFCYVEDTDLGFRLRLAGYKALYAPDAVVHHIGSATTGGQRSAFSVYHGHRNLVWTFVKNMPGPLLWLLAPLHVALNLVTVAVFVARGQGRAVLKAKRDAIAGLPPVWAKRRAIQSRRTASVQDIWRVLDKRLFVTGKSRHKA